jgi:hypothetical protein
MGKWAGRTDGSVISKCGHEAGCRKKVILQNEAIFLRGVSFVMNRWSMCYENSVSESFTVVD